MSFFQYNVQGVFVQRGDPNASAQSGLQFLPDVQSHIVALNYPYEDVFDVSCGGGTTMVQRPTVSQEISYLVASGVSETAFGFNVDGNTPALLGIESERNIYTVAGLDRLDLVGYSGSNTVVMALGNGVVTNYSVNCAVGQIPSASITVEGLNMRIDSTGSNCPLPSLDKRTASGVSGVYSIPALSLGQLSSGRVVRPSELFLQFDTGCSVGVAMNGANACKLQSFSFNIALPRHDTRDLGWAYPDQRPLQWPITVNIQAQAYVTTYQLAALNQASSDDGYGISLLMRRRDSNLLALKYHFRGAKLQNQSFNGQIEGLNQVTFEWSVKIGDLRADSITAPNFYIETFYGTTYFIYDYSEEMVGYDALGNPYSYVQDYYREVRE